jgi:hypothetical protein
MSLIDGQWRDELCGLSDSPPSLFSGPLLWGITSACVSAALLGFLYVWGFKTAAQTGDQPLGSRATKALLLIFLCTVVLAMGLGVWLITYHVMLSVWLDRQYTVLYIEQRLGSTCTISDAFVRHLEAATDRATSQEIFLLIPTALTWLLFIAFPMATTIHELLRRRRAQVSQ